MPYNIIWVYHHYYYIFISNSRYDGRATMTTTKLWRSWFLEPVCRPPPTAVSDPWKYVIGRRRRQQCSSEQQQPAARSAAAALQLAWPWSRSRQRRPRRRRRRKDRPAGNGARRHHRAAKESNAYVRTRDNGGGGAADAQTAFSQSFAFRCRVRSSSVYRVTCAVIVVVLTCVRACTLVVLCCVPDAPGGGVCECARARQSHCLHRLFFFFRFHFYRVRLIFSRFSGNISATILPSWFYKRYCNIIYSVDVLATAFNIKI